MYSSGSDVAVADRAEGALSATLSRASESLEGVLSTQLVAGHINRLQDVLARASLAARDDERHPQAVPPKTGS